MNRIVLTLLLLWAVIIILGICLGVMIFLITIIGNGGLLVFLLLMLLTMIIYRITGDLYKQEKGDD